jgi:hypothetical protein
LPTEAAKTIKGGELSPSKATYPFVGKWRIVHVQLTSEAKLPLPDKSSAVFSQEADGTIHYTAEGEFADGRKTHMEAVFQVDGTPYPVKGSPAGDALSFRQIADRVFQGTITRAGVVTARTIAVVSADASHTTTNWEFYSPEGTPTISFTTTAARRQDD